MERRPGKGAYWNWLRWNPGQSPEVVNRETQDNAPPSFSADDFGHGQFPPPRMGRMGACAVAQSALLYRRGIQGLSEHLFCCTAGIRTPQKTRQKWSGSEHRRKQGSFARSLGRAEGTLRAALRRPPGQGAHAEKVPKYINFRSFRNPGQSTEVVNREP